MEPHERRMLESIAEALGGDAVQFTQTNNNEGDVNNEIECDPQPTQLSKKPDVWLTVCPFSFEVKAYRTKEEATADSIHLNSITSGHPAYRLWCLEGGVTPVYVGMLWRDFGEEFDPERCWKRR